MSQFEESVPRDIALAKQGRDDTPDIPPPAQDQDAQEESSLSDGSRVLFSMYFDRANEEDKKMVECWKGDAEGMLVFIGLFSVVVAASLVLSLPTIRPNPQNASSFYLARLYQHSFTQPNGSQPPIPSSLNDPIEPFVPPTSCVWVNGLWFLSLVINLTCGLLATLLQQWARRYLRVAYPRYSPYKRARIHAFYKHGVETLHIPYAIELLPALFHISLFLFFAGISVLLFSIHPTIFKVVTAWTGICAILYAIITVLPIIRKDSPYSAPFSSPLSFCLTSLHYILSRLLQRFLPIFFNLIQWFLHIVVRLLQRFLHIDASVCMLLCGRYPNLDDFSHSMNMSAEQYALEQDPDIVYRSLLWTFESLDEDVDLEKFFEGLPRLCESETGKSLNLQQGFIVPNRKTLSHALKEMMNRTLLSNLASESVKQRRLIICTKAIESTSLFGPWWFLHRVLLGGWHRFLGRIEFGLFVQNWKEIVHPVTLFYRQCVAVLTIIKVRDHDDCWKQLVNGLLSESKLLLHKHIGNDDGDSILLANAIFIVRRTVQTYSGSAERHREDIINASSKTLKTGCELDIQRTLPELQHEFCGLWNKLVAAAQSNPPPHHGFVATTTLKNIRKLYIALHECSGTHPTPFYTTTDDRDPILDNPKLYPMCTIDGHLPPGPIPDLKFDKPPSDTGEGPSTLDMTPMFNRTCPYPPRPPAFPTPSTPTPFSPPAAYHTLTAPTRYSPRVIERYSHLGVPPPDATVPFPQPDFTGSHTPNVQPGAIMRPPPPPHISISFIPTGHLDSASTASGSSSGHGQFSRRP